jgi:hypothetical protein
MTQREANIKARLSKTRRNIRRIFHFACSLLLTSALLYAVFHEQGLGDFIDILMQVNTTFLGMYVCMNILGIFFRAVRYSLLFGAVQVEKTIGLRKLLVVTMIRNALVDFLPARLGELSYLYVVNRYGVPVIKAVSTFGFCIFLDILVLLLMLFVLGFTTLMFSLELQVGNFILLLGLAVGFLVFSIILFKLDKILTFILKIVRIILIKKNSTRENKIILALRWVGKICEKILSDFKIIALSGHMANLLFVTLCLRILKYSSLYILLIAILQQWELTFWDVNLFRAILAFIMAEASASLPISGLMGFGAYEGVWTLVFSYSCEKCEVIPSVPSVAFAIHLITQVVGYSIGMLGLLFFLFHQYKTRFNTSNNLP